MLKTLKTAFVFVLLLGVAACAAPQSQLESRETHSANDHIPPPDFSKIDALGSNNNQSAYLHYEIEDKCGATGALGSNRFRPQAWQTNYDPVCGCNGKTYSNVCAANSNGVSVASQGECS